MKQFSLVKNDRGQFPELPQGFVVVYDYKHNAIANIDYNGVANGSAPRGIKQEWFPLSRDFDSTMAWHGERKYKDSQLFEYVKVIWKEEK
jgi:hypothetical protein